MTRRESVCVAELKFEEYSYEMKEQLDQPTPIAPERPEVIVVPLSPARHLQRISKLEKTIASFYCCVSRRRIINDSTTNIYYAS